MLLCIIDIYLREKISFIQISSHGNFQLHTSIFKI